VLTLTLIYSIIQGMNKYKDFPEQPRCMTNAEGEEYFDRIVKAIGHFSPTNIVGVARTGLIYATWVSQLLSIRNIGIYYPGKDKLLMTDSNPERVAFVDDNTVTGNSYLRCKEYMARNYPQTKFVWAVLYTDWNTPENIRNEVIQGTRLPYFAEEPFWGSKKISKDYGVRFRDE
jgi:hypoxanthine phosphoribosyltransferase